jgi:TPR repeat protein
MSKSLVLPRARFGIFLSAATLLTLAITAVAGGDPAKAQSPALSDPRVKRCLFMALRRENPKLDAITTTVDEALAMLDIPALLDGFTTCRAALAAFPAEPKVIVAHYNAVEAVAVLLFGIEMPRTDAECVTKAGELAADFLQTRKSDMLLPMYAVFLGSASEFGIGTSRNIPEAAKWYRIAADAGSEVARRELDRMLAATGSGK